MKERIGFMQGRLSPPVEGRIQAFPWLCWTSEFAIAEREAVRVDPTHALAHNDLAWLLLTGPQDARDPKEALPLARKAVELAPDQPLYRNTLGVALYRTGQFAESVGVLETSLREGKGEHDAFDLFFLAMCHQKLGDSTKAKEYYDWAVDWVEKQAKTLSLLHTAELTQFRAEAAEVLGVKGPRR